MSSVASSLRAHHGFLACNLRVHPDLGSIKIPNSTVSLPVVSLYADDTSAIVTSDPGIKAVFDSYSRLKELLDLS